MDSKMNEIELDNILNEINIKYNVINLFDFSEDKIPLSRVINSIIDLIIQKYDGILIKESNKNTLGLKTSLINKLIKVKNYGK